ncbi:hypothetical protein ABKN59_006491 [Abortiporus biennis]
MYVLLSLPHEDAGHTDDERIKRSALSVAARTCKSFMDPALDLLWKELSGFEAALKVLQPGIDELNAMVFEENVPLDWSRFQWNSIN